LPPPRAPEWRIIGATFEDKGITGAKGRASAARASFACTAPVWGAGSTW
jgi:hypothetical protein